MKRFIALVGPKGAGKSTIGHLLASELGIHFIRVEPLFLEVRERLGALHPEYERTGFELTVRRLIESLERHDTVCFESTGASSWFEWQLARLREVAHVDLVRVAAGAQQCLERVRGRDASIHIPVSDDRVAEINAIASRVELPWTAEIDNRGEFDAAGIVETFRRLLANPWLSIPLADYEGHMALPAVAQAQALASELAGLLEHHRPPSLALVGCAGGNGLERVDPSVTRRVVAVDLNPEFVETARGRFASRFERFEPVVCDIAACASTPFVPVALLYAGLLLEYVPLLPALRFIRAGLETGGVFGCVLQEASPELPSVSPSPYTSLANLGSAMHLVAPGEVRRLAESCGFEFRTERRLRMPNGKILVSQEYAAR